LKGAAIAPFFVSQKSLSRRKNSKWKVSDSRNRLSRQQTLDLLGSLGVRRMPQGSGLFAHLAAQSADCAGFFTVLPKHVAEDLYLHSQLVRHV
jgi:hypothetical protein